MPATSDLERLVTWTTPYGKYKGQRLADLPGHYLGWFVRHGFPEGELGRLLHLMHEIDHNGLRPLLTPLGRSPAAQAPRRLP
jgi:uncharacterized protein (DUF3820 family)